MSPSVRVIAGAGAVDTILTLLSQTLLVEVQRAAGAPARGVVVRFTAAIPADPIRRSESGVFVCHRSLVDCIGSKEVTDTTDASGRVQIKVRLGSVAGPTSVVVSVAELGIVDVAPFTVRAGATARVYLGARDTAVYAGARYGSRAVATDQFGNATAERLTFSTSGRAAAIDANGVITAMSLGRTRIVAAGSGGADTAFVSVVPRGRIVAHRYMNFGYDSVILLAELDGSSVRAIPFRVYANDVRPQWSPDGAAVLYAARPDGGGGPRLFLVDTAGRDIRPLLPTRGELFGELHGTYAAGGEWVYFTGLDSSSVSNEKLWRVRRDGSSRERVGLVSATSAPQTRPAVSPDGRLLAYESRATNDVAVIDLETRHTIGRSIQGFTPSWSPDGRYLAVVTARSEIAVVRPDGSERRVVSLPGVRYLEAVDWSPDGEWIIASAFTEEVTLELVNVGSGERLPLPFARYAFQPAWLRR